MCRYCSDARLGVLCFDLTDELDTLLELVNKTVPMTPIKELIDLGPMAEFTASIEVAHCPKCHNRVFKNEDVCSKCAQALDWSNYE